MRKFLFTLVILISLTVISAFTLQTKKSLPQIDKQFLVHLHIVTDLDSNLATTLNDVNDNIEIMNAVFSKIGVSFVICEVDTIYNFNYLEGNTGDHLSELKNLYNQKNRINLYLFDTYDDDEVCGKASLGGIKFPSVAQVSVRSDCGSGTFIHEFGHLFGLPHTFDTDSGRELVDGSNCETAGDGVCDTPADPYYTSSNKEDWVNDAGEFIAEVVDANGDFYSPHVGNIMAYYKQSGCEFTDGQYIKMVETYNSSKVAW